MNQIEYIDGSVQQLTKDQAIQVSDSIENINLSNTKFIRFIENGRVTYIPISSVMAIMIKED